MHHLLKSSLKFSENLGEGLTSIMAGADQRYIPPFIKVLFNTNNRTI